MSSLIQLASTAEHHPCAAQPQQLAASLHLPSTSRQVNTLTVHFVTPVAPEARGKRLCFNGWWQAAWEPRSLAEVEDMLQTVEQRSRVTAQQYAAIHQLMLQAPNATAVTATGLESGGQRRLAELVAQLPPLAGQRPQRPKSVSPLNSTRP